MKSQDVLVCIRLYMWKGADWTYAQLSESLNISTSETHAAVKRLKKVSLFDTVTQSIRIKAFEEFLIHAVKFIFPAETGRTTRGIKTAHAAPLLSDKLVYKKDEEIFVWPYESGNDRGMSITPLYRTVPQIALKDKMFYGWMALIDILRMGRARDREVAITILRKLITKN